MKLTVLESPSDERPDSPAVPPAPAPGAEDDSLTVAPLSSDLIGMADRLRRFVQREAADAVASYRETARIAVADRENARAETARLRVRLAETERALARLTERHGGTTAPPPARDTSPSGANGVSSVEADES